MRKTTKGLHPGVRIHNTEYRLGSKHSTGAVSREPSDDGTIAYRCDFNLGEHTVPLEQVRLLSLPRVKNGVVDAS